LCARSGLLSLAFGDKNKLLHMDILAATQSLIKHLDDQPVSFRLDIEDYAVFVNSNTMSFRLVCSLRYSSAFSIIRKDSSINDLRVEVSIIPRTSESHSKENIGFIAFYDAIKTDDGVVNSPDLAEAKVTASLTTLEMIYRMIVSDGKKPFLVLDILGMEKQSHQHIWNVDKGSTLDIADFRFVLAHEETPHDQSDHLIEQRLQRIEEHLQSGVRVRLFS
jgi:hypothetical protein